MIYLLEDDASIRELVCYSLIKTGTDARGFAMPTEFYAALEEEKPSLVLLDVMLPEEDGLSVLTRLKASPRTRDIPVIMLTAKGSEFDKVTALDKGADDYVVKPFGVMELVARVHAVLRRCQGPSALSMHYSSDGVELDVEKHEVRFLGKEIPLTYKEFELLALLFENRGIVMTRDRILKEVWGYEFDGENRTVDVHIRTLRQKLGEGERIIETVRGVGHKIGGKNNDR